MTLHEARKIAYDVKANVIDPRMFVTGHVDTAIFTLEKGRAVKHKRDSDIRLASHLRSRIGMSPFEGNTND